MLLASASAGAQERPDAYEASYMRGTELFAAGQFAEARGQFLAAYELHPEPLLLLNIGSTYRREGDAPRALDYYRRYLAEAPPDDPYRAKVESIVDELEADVAEAEPPPRAGEPAGPRPREPVAIVPTPTPEPAPDRGRGLRIAGIASAAAGAVALGIGVQQGVHARGLQRDLEAEAAGTAWTDDLQRRYDDGEAAEARAAILVVTGGLAVAAGVTLYLVGRRDRAERPAVTVAPYTDGATTGLTLGASF